MAEFCINSLLPPVHVAHCSVLHSSTISVAKYEDYRHRNPNSNDKLVRPQTILGAVVSRKKISDICHQNASDAKYAFGAGDGNCLDILLYPRGRRQALHPLKDVPQGVDQIFLNKLYFSLEKEKVDDKIIFSRTSPARLCWSLGEALALEGSCVSSQNRHNPQS